MSTDVFLPGFFLVQIVGFFNFCITFGNCFLQSPGTYDELYYEHVRISSVVESLYEFSNGCCILVCLQLWLILLLLLLHIFVYFQLPRFEWLLDFNSKFFSKWRMLQTNCCDDLFFDRFHRVPDNRHTCRLYLNVAPLSGSINPKVYLQLWSPFDF